MTERLWGAPDPGFIVLSESEWVPAREILEHLEGRPDEYVVRSANGIEEWTVGEIRHLASTGQAICIPHVLPTREEG